MKDRTVPSDPTAPDGPTGRLASWAARLDLADVPDPIRERAKVLLLDGIGCALIGAQLPWSRTAVEAMSTFEGAGDSILIGWGRGLGATAATVLNGTFVQGFELDDFHPFAPLHSASLLLPSLLAVAQLEPDLDGADLLRGAIVGFETGPRVGLALHGADMLSRGWHSGPVFGTLAVAAAVGRAIGSDAATIEHGLGLAAVQSAGLMAAQFGSMGKRMHHGMASRAGLSAALLARGGYTGIEQVLELPYGGYLSTFGEGHDPDASQAAADLGERWETERIVVKPYAAMGGLHAGIDALLEIGTRRPLVASEIDHIDVDLGHAVYHHGWWPPERPLTPTGAQMNVAYSLAVAALDGTALAHQYAPGRIDRDDVWDLMGRIEAHHDEGFDALGAMGRGQTRVRIRFTDGSVETSEHFAARSVLKPLTTEEVVAKFRSLTHDVVPPERVAGIEAFVLTLDEQIDLRPLVDLLAHPVASPFGGA